MKKILTLTLSSLIILASINLTSCGNRNKKHGDAETDSINDTYKDGCNERTRKSCATACATMSCEEFWNHKITVDANSDFWSSCGDSFEFTIAKLTKNSKSVNLCKAAGPLGKASATAKGFTTIVGSAKHDDEGTMDQDAKDIDLSDSDLAIIKNNLR